MKVKCKNCGYEREHLGENEDFECPLCSGDMLENRSFLKEQIVEEALEAREIEALLHDIDIFGKKEVWRLIEVNIKDPIARLQYRQIYFKALKMIGENYEI